MRHGFIVTQVALAFVLLTGAGMLGLSLQRVLMTAPGFRADHVLTGSVSLPWKGYPEDKERLAFVQRLIAELRNQPGVASVGLTSGLPMTGTINNNATTVEGQEPKEGDGIRAHYMSSAVGEYWQTLGIPLVEGRYLEDADNQREQRVCVVDQDFAKRYWPGQSALGRRISNNPKFEAAKASTIVGVVGNVKQTDLTESGAQGAVYFPYKQSSDRQFSIVVRTQMDPAALAPMLQKAGAEARPRTARR